MNVFPDFDFSKNLELAKKLVDLNVAKCVAITEANTSAMKSLVEQTQTRIADASGIKGYDGLIGFAQEQTKIVQSNMKNWITSFKTTAEDTMTHGEEVQQILDPSVKANKPAAKKAA